MDGRSLPSWHDDDLVSISALEHWSYCPRQCGLIHVEQIFDENRLTLRGRRAHERIDRGEQSGSHGVVQRRSITLWSDRLGLIGKSDIVEWRGTQVTPVETKGGSGARRDWRHEAIQLCAQAICLEEMLSVEIHEGAIYAAADHRRIPIPFDRALRNEVERMTAAVRAMIREHRLPPAVDDARCRNCSLAESCAPGIAAHPARVRQLHAALFRMPTAAEELAGHPLEPGDPEGEDEPWNS